MYGFGTLPTSATHNNRRNWAKGGQNYGRQNNNATISNQYTHSSIKIVNTVGCEEESLARLKPKGSRPTPLLFTIFQVLSTLPKINLFTFNKNNFLAL